MGQDRTPFSPSEGARPKTRNLGPVLFGERVIGVWVNLVDRSLRVREVVGSNPATPILFRSSLSFPRGKRGVFDRYEDEERGEVAGLLRI